MGNSCCTTKEDNSNNLVLLQFGLDDEGIEHDFQYHVTKLNKNGIKLGAHETILR